MWAIGHFKEEEEEEEELRACIPMKESDPYSKLIVTILFLKKYLKVK
jgi:hypothetical protein